MLEQEAFIKLSEDCKYKICEDIFGEGNFNFELFQYALEKVFDEERKVREEEERLEEERNPKPTILQRIKKSSFMKYVSGGVVVLSIGSIAVHYYLYSGAGSFFK